MANKIDFRNLLINTFPALIIIFISIMSFLSTSSMQGFIKFNWHGFLRLSLISLFPILFLLQGIFSYLTNGNVLVATTISLISFVLIILVLLDCSLSKYGMGYPLCSLIGYVSVKVINKKIIQFTKFF